MSNNWRRLALSTMVLLLAMSNVTYAKTTITMWLSSQPVGVTAWADAFERSFNEKNPDIELNLELYPNVTAQREKLIVAVAGGVAPDIVYDSCNLMPQWFNNQIALPIDKYFNAWPGKNDVMPDMLNWLRFGGKLWGMPYSVWSIGDLYSMDVFTKNGVGLPNTWDEMITTAKRLRKIEADGTISVTGYNIPIADLSAFIELQLTMEQLGGTIIEVGDRVAKLNTDAARQALTFLREVAQAGRPGLAGLTDIKAILRGEVGVWHSFAGYNLVSLNDAITAGGHQLAYRRFIGPQPNKESIQGNGGMLFITQASRNPDQAWKVIEAFMEKGNLKGYLLAHGAALPARISLHSDNDLRSTPWAKELISVLSPPILAYSSRHQYSTDFRVQAGAKIKLAILNQAGIEDVLTQAQSIINQVVNEKMGAAK